MSETNELKVIMFSSSISLLLLLINNYTLKSQTLQFYLK